MSRPVRRGRGAIGIIISTVVSVVTLPFRVLAQLFGRSRRRRRL
ncbi:MAG: LPFR motif small protein [Pseudonocardiaceae bacterium]